MAESATLPQVQLYHGDCLEVMPTLANGSVAMVFADLPYRSKSYQSTECHWDIPMNLEAFWGAAQGATLANAAFVFTGAQPFTTDLICSNRSAFRYTLVWDKHFPGNFMHAKRIPMRHHEDIVVFYRKQPTYNPQMVLRDKPIINKIRPNRKEKSKSAGVRRWRPEFEKTYTHAYPRSIIDITKRESGPGRGLHPTQKPVALLEWLIKTYTNPGDTVLDPCAGSFTTAVAALRTGRSAICIEKDAGYFAIGKARVEAEQARLAGAA